MPVTPRRRKTFSTCASFRSACATATAGARSELSAWCSTASRARASWDPGSRFSRRSRMSVSARTSACPTSFTAVVVESPPGMAPPLPPPAGPPPRPPPGRRRGARAASHGRQGGAPPGRSGGSRRAGWKRPPFPRAREGKSKRRSPPSLRPPGSRFSRFHHRGGGNGAMGAEDGRPAPPRTRPGRCDDGRFTPDDEENCPGPPPPPLHAPSPLSGDPQAEGVGRRLSPKGGPGSRAGGRRCRARAPRARARRGRRAPGGRARWTARCGAARRPRARPGGD